MARKKKLLTPERWFVPDMTFIMEEDNGTEVMVDNRDLPDDEQVRCEIKIARIGQKSKYLGSYTVANAKQIKTSGEVKQVSNFQYEKCVSEQVGTITGLEDYNINNGKQLIRHTPSPELIDIIQECFFKINGIHTDDTTLTSSNGAKEDSDSGDFSSEEY